MKQFPIFLKKRRGEQQNKLHFDRRLSAVFFCSNSEFKKTKKNKKKSKKVLTSIFFSAIIIARKGTETRKNETAERQKERGITMKYTVKVISNFNVTEFESDSRNAKKHLVDNGGHTCKVYDKKGEQISECRYSDEFGYYRCNF